MLADVASGESGSVSFTGVVNESAIEGGVDNKAGIQLGENGPVISTNTESTKMGSGDLTISKQVKSAIADVTAPTAEFTFDVTLTDAAGKQLTNTESTKMGSGDLTISKQVKSAIADVTAPTAEFTFDVTLTDAAGKQLAGTYNYEGDKKGVIENGAGTIALKHDQSVTIKGAPTTMRATRRVLSRTAPARSR